MEVNRAIPNPTPPEVGDISLTQLVKEWTTKKNRNPTGARMGINLGKVCTFHTAGIHLNFPIGEFCDRHSVGF